jgi:hypothetical protein
MEERTGGRGKLKHGDGGMSREKETYGEDVEGKV